MRNEKEGRGYGGGLIFYKTCRRCDWALFNSWKCAVVSASDMLVV
jgi:hypothetical protein